MRPQIVETPQREATASEIRAVYKFPLEIIEVDWMPKNHAALVNAGTLIEWQKNTNPDPRPWNEQYFKK